MSAIELDFALARGNFQLQVATSIPARGVTALFGPSGSGKTTLLRCIAGLEQADSGRLRVNGETWQGEGINLPVHRRALGYVFQESSLFSHLDVRRNLLYGLKRTPAAERRIPFAEAVGLLNIQALLELRPQQLSGGQRQRVAIARALLSSPKLLLMDEPMASLDLQGKAEILPYLDSIHERLQIPVIYVSHSPEEVVRIADHMLLLDNGRVQASGALNQLLTRTDLPLAHLDEACAVVDGEIVEHDRQYHLTYLAVAGGRLAISYLAKPIGHRARIRILARDVSLARQPAQQSSIINVLPVRVAAIEPSHDPAKLLLKLDMGGDFILAQITAKSAALLALQRGEQVYAQVKSVALMR
ncbi:MAG: molybdenum ABC transporter ATP-binding protein [Gammaproteobacteria bacterium]|nr:molybdenum ABC transporter ATP-binding protein [Gammaproteobacteria bacterium]